MIRVPETFARDAVTRSGDAGRGWVDELPALVQALCEAWGLAADGEPMHGYLGLVVPVVRGAERCVLKVSWQDESTRDEAAALSAWNGHGAVRLLAHDRARGALLLERADHRRSLMQLPVAEAAAIAGGLLRRLSIPAPAGVRPLGDFAATLAITLPERWERHGRPMPRRTVDRACDLALQLGPRAASLLVNYDLHYADVLGGERERWLVVDPKVVAGDPEFGIAQLLWTRLEEMEAGGGVAHHLAVLVGAAETDDGLARAWTLVRCVDYWLWGLDAGLTEDPARCERIIHRLGLGD